MTLIKSIAGIRGTIGGIPGESLTPPDIIKFTSAYGEWIKSRQNSENRIVIGRDARPSGPVISQLVSATLQAQGFDVIDLGLTTTPTVEMAVPREKAGGGIIITASHNPAGWNALKLLNESGEFISAENGEEVLTFAESDNIQFSEPRKFGKYSLKEDYIDWHIEQVVNHPLVQSDLIREKKFHVIVDAVNSTGGIAVPKLLDAIGVTYETLYCEPNGMFPHNPEPLPENLMQIRGDIESGQFDLGIVVDPDVDRLVFISENGEPFGEEYTLVAAADYVLSKQKGNTVSNLSSTRALRDVTEKRGGTYYPAAVGEVNVVAKMKEVNAVIGGEGNGGVIMPDLHYGRDALIGIALILSHLAECGKSAARLRSSFPNYHISKNKIELTPDIDVDQILEKLQEKYAANPVNTVDGVKIEFDKEWVHLRKSNTEPIIRIFAESESLATAEHLANKLISDIKEIISD